MSEGNSRNIKLLCSEPPFMWAIINIVLGQCPHLVYTGLCLGGCVGGLVGARACVGPYLRVCVRVCVHECVRALMHLCARAFV